MGKKKISKTNPEAFKEEGNKAFARGSFEEAVKLYTQAIDLTEGNPNHIYFANRANAYGSLGEFDKCI
jgi:tetratricopeptide (TPR) repeat protein